MSEGRRYRFNALRISAISLAFSGMMPSTMKQTATLNGHAQPIFVCSTKLSMIGLGQEDEIEEITLRSEICGHDAVCHEVDHCIKWFVEYYGR